jgi:hypothetical protein
LENETRKRHCEEQAPQSPEIASLRPEHHAVQGFVRNDKLIYGLNLRRIYGTRKAD